MKPRAALSVPQFSTAHAAQPAWYRATNWLGKAAPKAFTPSAERIIHAAHKKHANLGEPRPETLAALNALVESLNNDAALSFVGRMAAGMD